METDSINGLQHGIPDPEELLPGPPAWFWALIIFATLITLFLLFLLIKHLTKKSTSANTTTPIDYYGPALTSLRELEPLSSQLPLSDIATRASLALRTYLAKSKSEPALYETTSEFQARVSTQLNEETSTLLTELNHAKYSKSSTDPDRSHSLVTRSIDCLQKLREMNQPTS